MDPGLTLVASRQTGCYQEATDARIEYGRGQARVRGTAAHYSTARTDQSFGGALVLSRRLGVNFSQRTLKQNRQGKKLAGFILDRRSATGVPSTRPVTAVIF